MIRGGKVGAFHLEALKQADDWIMNQCTYANIKMYFCALFLKSDSKFYMCDEHIFFFLKAFLMIWHADEWQEPILTAFIQRNSKNLYALGSRWIFLEKFFYPSTWKLRFSGSWGREDAARYFQNKLQPHTRPHWREVENKSIIKIF